MTIDLDSTASTQMTFFVREPQNIGIVAWGRFYNYVAGRPGVYAARKYLDSHGEEMLSVDFIRPAMENEV